MRGRKHPLEVFRTSGREFVTRRGESPSREPEAGETPARPGARESREAGADRDARAEPREPERPRRRSLRPLTPAEIAREREARSRTDAAGEARPAREPAAPERAAAEAPKATRRSWEARGPSGVVAAAAKGRSRSRRPLALPLPQLAGALAVLVLLVGGAYALGLWPFAPGSVGPEGRRTLPLQRFLSSWRDPVVPSDAGDDAAGDAAAPEAAAGAPGSEPTSREAEGARADPEIEFWIVAASLKLTAEMKKDDAWKERVRLDKEKLARELGADLSGPFPGLIVEACQTTKTQDVLLRIGPAASADDPALRAALERVRGLKGSFKEAHIKAFRKRS